MAAKKEKMIVRAVTNFVGAQTGKTFRPGDIVTETWDEERALYYQDAGLVKVVYAPEAEDPQMKLEDAPGPEETEKKPGPKETKPKSGGTVKK